MVTAENAGNIANVGTGQENVNYRMAGDVFSQIGSAVGTIKTIPNSEYPETWGEWFNNHNPKTLTTALAANAQPTNGIPDTCPTR